MHSIKSQIITAFENLDADALELLLDDNKTYQDVPKKIFVERYREYFRNLKEDVEVLCDFKAYPGKCNHCSKDKKGYSFVNSQNTSYAELIFIEDDDNYLDIYACKNFDSTHCDIADSFGGISFCDDEKVGHMLTFEELVEKEFCLSAVKEIEDKIKENKILPLKFIKDWRNKYNPLYGDLNIFESKNYSFINLVKNYLGSICNALNFIEFSKKATLYIDLFKDPVFQDDEAIMMWMFPCIEDIPDVKFYLHAKVSKAENYIAFGKVNVDLSYMQDYLDLQEIYRQHYDLLPYSIMTSFPWDWKNSCNISNDNLNDMFDDNEQFPY